MKRAYLISKFRIIFLVLLIFVMLSPVFFSLEVKAQTQTDYYTKTFEWDYAGDHWEWNLTIPKALYDEYKSVPVSRRIRTGPSGYGFMTTTEDYYMQLLAEKLNETTTKQGYDYYDQVSFVLAFVQSLPYASDNVTSAYDEYPRFPIETLVDDGGDCEDTSVLFGTLTLLLGYDTVYINPPNHYAVGILGEDLPGTYWIYNNQTYYYCETTGKGFKIGQVPEEFKNAEAYIYEINLAKQYIANYQITPANQPTPSNSLSPTNNAPIIEPVSLTALFSQPVFLILITVAIAISITAVAVTAKKPTKQTQNQPTNLEPITLSTANVQGIKYCIFCGGSNQTAARYCEKCGQKIG